MAKSGLQFVQLHPIVWRILQLLGIFPFQMDQAGRPLKDGRLVALVLCFISAFYALFYSSAHMTYLSVHYPPSTSFWAFVSTIRIHISVWVLNFSIAWNLIQRNRHARLLNNLRDLVADADMIDPSREGVGAKILRTTFWKFIALSIFDWIINAPLVIYTNTFTFIFWLSVFWGCFTFQNYISNLLFLYINHLTKLTLYPNQVIMEVLKSPKRIDSATSVEILRIYEKLFKSIRLFESIYGPLILMNFVYDFVFIVSQFFLFTYFVLTELIYRVSMREIMVILRCIVFITPNCAKLFAVTYTMGEVTIKVSDC